MYQDTYWPVDVASAVTRRMMAFVGKVLIWFSYRGLPAALTKDALSEKSLRLLAEAEQEIDSIRHDVEIYSLNSAERSADHWR